MRIVDRILSDHFVKNNIIYFAGTLTTGFFSYLFHPVLSRLMGVADFGDTQALLSFSALTGGVVAIFGTIIVNLIANGGDEEKKKQIISSLRKIAFYAAGFVFSLFLAGSFFLKNFFNFSSLPAFILLIASIPLSVSVTVRSAFLHGRRNFKTLSLGGVISSSSRLLFAAFFVILGWRTFGAMFGLLAAQLVALGYLYLKTRQDLIFVPASKPLFSKDIRRELAYGLLIFATTFTITFLYSADILVVKHYFSAGEAGLYSGIATVGRVIFFLCASVVGVLFPSVSLANTPTDNQRLLIKALAIIFLIGGLIWLSFLIAPCLFINLLIGSRYASHASLLPRLGLLSFLVALVQVLFMYHLALRHRFILLAAGAGVLIGLLLSYYNHASLEMIINNFIFASLAVIAVIILAPRLLKYKQKISI